MAYCRPSDRCIEPAPTSCQRRWSSPLLGLPTDRRGSRQRRGRRALIDSIKTSQLGLGLVRARLTAAEFRVSRHWHWLSPEICTLSVSHCTSIDSVCNVWACVSRRKCGRDAVQLSLLLQLWLSSPSQPDVQHLSTLSLISRSDLDYCNTVAFLMSSSLSHTLCSVCSVRKVQVVISYKLQSCNLAWCTKMFVTFLNSNKHKGKLVRYG